MYAEMNLFDAFMLVYLPLGIYGINKLRPLCLANRSWKTYAYHLVLVLMTAGPLIYLQGYANNYSEFSVVLAGICLFGFSFLGSKNDNT